MNKWKDHFGPRNRRLYLLGLFIVSLSVFDLIETIFHTLNFGFFETNPIARILLSQSSIWPLVIFKTTSVIIALFSASLISEPRLKEATFWVMAIILICVSFMWSDYSHEIEGILEKHNILERTDMNELIEKSPN